MENSYKIIYTNIPEHEQPETFGLSFYPLQKWLQNPINDYYYNIWIREELIPNNIIEIAKTYDNFYLFLNDSLEGFAKRTFPKIYEITCNNQLQNKIIYVSGHFDVKEEYKIWLKQKSVNKVFEVEFNNQWYYRIKDQAITEDINLPLEKKEWVCCLNNRGHKHRIDTVNYLYRNNIKKHVSALWKNVTVDIKNDKEVIIPHYYSYVHSDCLFNITTETYYSNCWNNYSEMFITEKTWKPIVAKQIFVIIGPKGILKKLQDLGFKTFGDYIDESYDNESDEKRLYSAIDSVKNAMNMYTIEELDKLTRHIREYNIKCLLCT